MPRNAFRLFLLNVKSDTINDDIKCYLKSLLNDVELNVNAIHYAKKGYSVDLSLTSNRENVSQKINNLAETLEPTSADKIFYYNKVSMKGMYA